MVGEVRVAAMVGMAAESRDTAPVKEADPVRVRTQWSVSPSCVPTVDSALLYREAETEVNVIVNDAVESHRDRGQCDHRRCRRIAVWPCRREALVHMEFVESSPSTMSSTGGLV